MNTVEPIRDFSMILDIADYLKSKNKRDYVLFMTGILAFLVLLLSCSSLRWLKTVTPPMGDGSLPIKNILSIRITQKLQHIVI